MKLGTVLYIAWIAVCIGVILATLVCFAVREVHRHEIPIRNQVSYSGRAQAT